MAIKGNYDDINRLCTQIADRHGWGFANINLRTYYAEGAKTYGFEIVEQLGWRFPAHVVCPVAGGTLLPRIVRAFDELKTLGLGRRRDAAYRTRYRPPVRRRSSARSRPGAEFPEPVKPNTIAKSIAIGNPADGYHVLQALRETSGSATMVTDDEILQAIQLLAETEGIFTEPAGGATLAGAIALRENGTISGQQPTVICITGNGYKTSDVLEGRTERPAILGKGLSEFEDYLAGHVKAYG